MGYRIAAVVPTNSYDTMKNFFLVGLKNLQSINDKLEILFNFQSMTDEEVQDILNICASLGLHTIHRRGQYTIQQKGHIPYNRIRQDTADLDSNADYYLLLDDDMIFLDHSRKANCDTGVQLSWCIDYLDQHPDCGSIVLDSNRSQKILSSRIVPAPIDYKCYVVNGLLLRNFQNGLLVPSDATELVGRGEDMVAVGWRLANGYYPARLAYTSILHSENHSDKPKPGKVQPSNAELGWELSDQIAAVNNYGYIKDHWNPEFSLRSGQFDIISSSLYETARLNLLKELRSNNG